MELLKKRILKDADVVGTEILKVDSFLNHQIDPVLMREIGVHFSELFSGMGVTKVVTIESSGIAPAIFTALSLGVPLLFAKKTESRNLDAETYQAPVRSFTKGIDYHIRVNKRFLSKEDKLLFIDDFLAKGQAILGLVQIAKDAGAEVVGAGIVIEKGFQDGGELIRQKGILVKSLAIVESMSEENREVLFSS